MLARSRSRRSPDGAAIRRIEEIEGGPFRPVERGWTVFKSRPWTSSLLDDPWPTAIGGPVIGRAESLSPTPPSRPRHGIEELDQRHTESARQSRQRGDPDIALAALDTADVVAVQTGAGGELLLRDRQVGPQSAHAPSHGPREIAGHVGDGGGLLRFGLHTIVFI